MSNTTFNRVLAGAEDLLRGDSTVPVNQTRDGVLTAQTVAITPLDSANYRLSSAAKTLLGLSGTKYLDDAFTSLASGSSLQYASTTQNGQIYRMSAAPAVAGQPKAMEENDARVGRIPTAAQDAGLDATPAEYTAFGSTAPSSGNGYITEAYSDLWLYGTGRDGAFKTGAVATQSTATGLTAVANGGAIGAGTYNVKVTAGNATGETNVSTASGNVTVSANAAIDLTVPVNGDADAAWRKVYISDNTGSGTYRLIAHIPDNTTTSLRITRATGGQAAPSSDTTAATWTTNVAGEYHFDGDVTLPALTLTGDLVIRCRGYLTIGGAITGTGVGNGTGLLRGISGFDIRSAMPAYSLPGFGSSVRGIEPPGRGGPGEDGSVSSTATLALPGAALIVYAYGVRIAANVTSNGGNGTNGGAGGFSGDGGGGGGILACVAREYVTSGTVTIALNGGNGGNATTSGAGYANRILGGQEGGGGVAVFIAPIIDVSAATINRNAGTAGTNAASSGTTYIYPGGGGSSSGDGAISTSVLMRAATAGQTITMTTQPFPLRI